jgi:uncharacterized protein (TIGR00730 family)
MAAATALSSICVFTGSNPGRNPAFAGAARAFGRLIGERGIALVFGGGRVGLMGQVADGCLAAGGSVTGVIPRALQEREVGHDGLSELHVVETMHERKALMASLSDAFVALPGGIGTCEELFEVWTWAQLGQHAKPVGLLNVAGFYDPLIGFIGRMIGDGFLRADHAGILKVETDGAALLAALAAYEPPPVHKWIELAET